MCGKIYRKFLVVSRCTVEVIFFYIIDNEFDAKKSSHITRHKQDPVQLTEVHY